MNKQTLFKVAGNLDQIQRHAAFGGLEWHVLHQSLPNRVACEFNNINDAKTLYDNMKSANIVSVKNWL